jgi:hypothetical protein
MKEKEKATRSGALNITVREGRRCSTGSTAPPRAMFSTLALAMSLSPHLPFSVRDRAINVCDSPV